MPDESEHKYTFSNALISKEKWERAFGRKKDVSEEESEFSQDAVQNMLQYSCQVWKNVDDVLRSEL